MTHLRLLCIIHGDLAKNVFTINIQDDLDVSALKNEICDRNPNTFEKVDFRNLLVWQVSIPITSREETILLPEPHPTPLVNYDQLSALFPASDEHSHHYIRIVVQAPHTKLVTKVGPTEGECSTLGLYLVSFTLLV
jgi:hypothetical protein